ncbi:MAG: hypothetical protein IJW26_05825, partial [Clostridia bacterium]|nr:hypothetical protein [Clostridia bacterium]
KEYKSVETFIVDAKEQIKDKEEEIRSTNEYIETLTRKISTLNIELSSKKTSLNLYSNLKDSFEGYNSSVRRLMQSAKTNATINGKIKGLVATAISTEQKYETAIQTAIGGAMQNVIVDTPVDAEYLINYLKQNDIRAVTFLPITSVKTRSTTKELELALKENGAIGLANNLVKYDPYFENIVNHLLGGTLICKDLTSARIIAQKYRFSFKIVTLDGDVLSQSGSMTGGAKRKDDTTLLSIDRKVNELTLEVENASKEIKRLEDNKAQLITLVNGQVDELNGLNTSLQDAKQNYAKLKEKIDYLESQLKSIEDEIEKNKDEIALIGARLQQIESEYTTIKQGNEILVKEKESASKEQDAHREQFEDLRRRRDTALERNTEIQSRLSYLRSEIASTNGDVARISNVVETLKGKIDANLNTIQSNEIIISKLKKEAENALLNDDEKNELNSLRQKRDEFDKAKAKLNEELERDDIKRGALQEDIDKNTEKLTIEKGELIKVDSDIEHLSDKISTSYGLNYEDCKKLREENYDVIKGQEEIISITKSIARLGNVNPSAIEEYEEYNSACQECITQRDDLVKAKEDLLKVIEDLTKEMTLTFDEGFKLIKENFSKTFKELFGGGRASLEILESQTGDPLDAGIEIVAEPPGKKLQKISLLSGGEMALTAIAILFAILRMRPMPFCVLDEIEAALDDANVDRFARYIKNFSK